MTILKSEEKRILANNIQLAYDTFGNPADPPILLIMGLGMQMIAWDELFCTQLAERGYWVIRFDNRDIGHSTKFYNIDPPGIWQMISAGIFKRPLSTPYNLKDMASDSIGLMNALNVESAHVVGASMGGMIAQELAIHHPERLLSLTSIMSTTGDPLLPQPKLSLRLKLLKRSPAELHAYEKHMVSLLKLLNGPHYPFDEKRVRKMATNSFKRCYYPKGIARQLAAVIASGSRKNKLVQIKTSALIIHGDADPLVPLSHGQATADAIPNARLHVISGMGHTMPEALWPEIIDTITGHTVIQNL